MAFLNLFAEYPGLYRYLSLIQPTFDSKYLICLYLVSQHCLNQSFPLKVKRPKLVVPCPDFYYWIMTSTKIKNWRVPFSF
jgi:hypothetical protein